jgi:hypothetical protein
MRRQDKEFLMRHISRPRSAGRQAQRNPDDVESTENELRRIRRDVERSEDDLKQVKRRAAKAAERSAVPVKVRCRWVDVGEMRKLFRRRHRMPYVNDKKDIDPHIEAALGVDWRSIGCEERSQRANLTFEEWSALRFKRHKPVDATDKQIREALENRRRESWKRAQQKRRSLHMKAVQAGAGLSERRESLFNIVVALVEADVEGIASAVRNIPVWRNVGHRLKPESLRAIIRRELDSLIADGFLTERRKATKRRQKRMVRVARNAHSTITNKRTKGQTASTHRADPHKTGTSANEQPLSTHRENVSTDESIQSPQSPRRESGRETLH